MKKTLLALAALALAAHASAATYNFTGNAYDPASLHNFTAPCSAGNCGNFTAAMAPVATFTTALPLAPNLNDTDVTTDVATFSAFDGLTTYASGDPLVQLIVARATTDASGQLTSLQLVAVRWQSPGPHVGGNVRLDSVNTTSGSSHNVICLATAPVPGGDLCTISEAAGSTDSNTSWAQPGLAPGGPGNLHAVPVDNPIALLLTATGLLSVALRTRRRTAR
ncbi:hypothetical protein ASE52_07690 [Acidovorax sp. Root275]|uniref:hypothetical protein n=1 Tax=Acidovorax sp. Root275 TaxID=1736508 RepID=UPI000709382F|nr:hypothetical protein [Acidovorax sp. Root275]KRD56069.1 hypothetical protein ASE52_07690 [Acidovorax sp. Root275]